MTNELILFLKETIKRLIAFYNVEIFLFGSKSQFDNLCYKIVSELREKYPHINRVKVRAEYQYISDDYKNYLLNFYEESYFPFQVDKAGKLSYIKRNQVMIDASDYCIFYYNKDYLPPKRKQNKRDVVGYQPKSGTELAYNYALHKNKNIINVYDAI